MNHKELCERAVKWLRGTAGCGVVISEMASYADEIPDAIGWRSGVSVLIEAKASRADFFAEKKKMARHYPQNGMGKWRFFITKPGLISPDELPEGWGLLEVHGNIVKRIHGVPKGNIWPISPHKANRNAEILLLCSALRRERE